MRATTQEPPHPVQVEAFRRMTPAQKLQMAADLYETVIRLKMQGLRMGHSTWTEMRLEHDARQSLHFAGT